MAIGLATDYAKFSYPILLILVNRYCAFSCKQQLSFVKGSAIITEALKNLFCNPITSYYL